MVMRLATATRNAAANAAADLLNLGAGAGTIKIYTGTQPATPNDAVTGTLLATVTLIDPAAGAAASGSKTITDPVSVNGVATGSAGWFRAADSTGAAVFDGSVTAPGGGGQIELSSISITSGVAVDLGALTFTVPV